MSDPTATSASAVIDNGAYGTRTIRFETGRLAQQAAGSVAAFLDEDTMLLSATTAGKHPKEQFDFFPLTIDVEERMYAAGRIPGSFFRREGRPSEDAILTCRLIDRPLRPTFKAGLRNEVQVVITVMALNPDELYDVLAINAASASTQISGLPFSGPVAGVRVALIASETGATQWVAFPTHTQLEKAVFDMVVAGRIAGDDVAIMMVEAEATEKTIELVAGGATAPTEEVVAEGLEAAKPFLKLLCEAQLELATKAAKPVADFPVFPPYQDDVLQAVTAAAEAAGLADALTLTGKQERDNRTDEIKAVVYEQLGEQFDGRSSEIGNAFRSVTKNLVRQRVLRDKIRMDGRGLTDIRTLGAEVGYLPRVHGSALFERGETQILGVTTLNMLRMEQQLDTLSPENRKRYMHNYNFPPYSTGETGRVGSPKRREIGHGALAERALVPVLPSREEFPYAIRQVSEALGSNGSTSMGSVCASTLSLLNAGVPLKAPVAGIAMGLVSDTVDGTTQYVALTDILGSEDAFGDMDFKVAGTKQFVTALQLDTKLDGIPSEVLRGALVQARDARFTILEVMNEAIDEPDPMSNYAPRITTIKVPVDKIGEVIGPKGKMINSITEQTGSDIAIEDDGTIFVSGPDGTAVQAAIDIINSIANPQLPKVGERFLGTVVKTTAFGAFVSLLPGRDGLVHISKLGSGKRIAKVEDVVNVGDKLQVEIAEIDARGKISLVPVAATDAPASNGAAEAVPLRSDRVAARTKLVPSAARKTRTRVLERGVDGSTVTSSELPGGLRVVTESVPGARSASVGVWVGVGSVDETPRLAGASHYLEHLLFKGTRYRSGYEIADAVDAVGGELNAFTSHEYTCYYARILAAEAELAVGLVCEVVLDTTVAAADVDTERMVILEEIAMRDDDPEDTLADLFAAAVFAGHPVASPVIGSIETITRMNRTQVAGYYRRRYTPDRMVISVAGGVEHADVLRWVKAAFRERLSIDTAAPAGFRGRRGRTSPLRRAAVVERDTEQAHLCVGVPSGDRNDPDRTVLAVLTSALGGGMSSRLFRSIREERGLAYSCYAASSAYSDVGSFSVYAGCQPDHLGEVAKLIGQELTLVAESGLAESELARVKGQLAGSLVLALEDTESRMSRIGKTLLVRKEFRSIEDELAAIRAVSQADVGALAKRLLSRPMTAAVVGPYASTDDLPAELTELVG